MSGHRAPTWDTKKDLPPESKIETGSPNFANTFNRHVLEGNIHGEQINGLHCLSSYIAQRKPIAKSNVVTDERFAAVYRADVTIGGGTKNGTFFPDTWTIDQVKAAVTEAWRDWKIFGAGASSSIYAGMTKKSGGSWAGLATFKTATAGPQKIWIAARGSGDGDKPIETAFPAVNNTFL